MGSKFDKFMEFLEIKPIKFGYQPTDKLDTSNPPGKRHVKYDIPKREYLYRGISILTKEWIYGNINYLSDGVYILESENCGDIEYPPYHHQGMGCGLEDRNIVDRYEAMEYGWHEAIDAFSPYLPAFIKVIPESVGQYIGIKDVNDVKIFEDDIVHIKADSEFCGMEWGYDVNGIIVYDIGECFVKELEKQIHYDFEHIDYIEVLGPNYTWDLKSVGNA